MNIPCNWNNLRRCGPSVALFILSLDMRKDVRDLNAHTLVLFLFILTQQCELNFHLTCPLYSLR